MNDIVTYEQYSEIVMMLTAVIMLLIFLPIIFPKFKDLIIKIFKNSSKNPVIADKSLEELIEDLGYVYDVRQDIFYTALNTWQRDMGYCRLYDEAAAPMSMIIDCEPIYFEYDNKRWLIEFWKGQYGMTTGCEIGVYSTDMPDVQTEIFNGTFYECVGDNDLLQISLTLKKNGKRLLTRQDIHWWVTGFVLGEFSEPDDLVVNLKITLKDYLMRDEFIKGLINAGYNEDEIVVVNNTVRLVFDKPRTTQPYTRNEVTDYIMQANNRSLCGNFNEITKDYHNSMDKIMYLRESAPELFEEFFNLGRKKDMFNDYWNIKNN
jgi:hypothetical protein